VVGAGADEVRSTLAADDLAWVTQSERLGTGHAALQALPMISPQSRVLILPGDMPLIRPGTVRRLLASEADLALLSFLPEDPTGYGRILRDGSGAVVAIREQRDASEAEKRVGEVNSGVLCAPAARLGAWLKELRADNAQGEYYLTDCVGLAVADGHDVAAIVAEDPGELMGANDRAQLASLERVFQERSRQALFDQGVTLLAAETVQVRGTVTGGRDVVIDAGVVLSGRIELGDGVTIAAGCVLSDVTLAAGTRVEPYCVLEGVTTHGACTIGPFARLRQGTELDEGVKIGNFVETKKARFGAGAKASHLTYAGDAEIGPGANIGAGSVISTDAPDDRLTVARARQRTIEGWQRPTKKP
jgi:bifunctional UDP-N-acetylglucosamine pyrophosphorylase/glucosamine-1-phosphate N-acetyltransferase